MPKRNRRSRPTGNTELAAGSFWWSRRLVLCGIGIIVLAAFLAYLPSLSGGFIFDDDVLLTENALIKAPSGILRFWYTADQPDYVPLTSSTLWLEWRLWGINPTGYHLTNLALHIAACLLIWLLLRKLAIPGAFLAALLFAVHPVNVESVAWIEQRKNTLSLVLFLLSILWYLRSADGETAASQTPYAAAGRWYWLSLLAFALAMFSKGSVVILPFALLLIAWWQRGWITKADLIRTAPFFLIAAVLTPVIIWFVSHGFGEVVRHVTFLQRLLGSGAVVWFYLSKAILPIHLAFVYPQWNIQPAHPLWWLPLVAALLVTALLWWKRGMPWGRALLFAWLFYIVALLPVLGFTDSGYSRFSLVADHYQYIALISITALVGAGWSAWHHRPQPANRSAATSAAVALTCVLTFLTWRQSSLYANAITLYQAALEQNPDSWMLHYNLGVPLTTTRRLPDAIQHFQAALKLNPNYPEAHLNLGIALAGQGKVPEAIDHFQESLKIKPNYADAHYNLGNVLAQTGHLPDAIEHYEQALRLKPDFAEAHNNLSTALYQSGQLQDAIAHDKEALHLKPNYVDALNNLANAELQLGRVQEAVGHYQQALKLQPDFYDAHFNLGAVLLKTGHTQQAIDQFQQALRSKPDDIDASVNLMNAYAQANRSFDAISMARKTLALARSSGQAELAQQIEGWIKNYSAHQSGNGAKSP